MIYIESVDDVRVADFRSLKERQSDTSVRTDHSIVVVESEAVVRQALKHPLRFRFLLSTQTWYDELRLQIGNAGIAEDQCLLCSESLFEAIVGFRMRKAIALSIERPDDSSLDRLESPILVLNALSDSENVGSIARSALALGFQSIITDQRCADPWLRRSVRVSMGALFSMKLHRSNTLIDDLQLLRQAYGCQLVVAELTSNSLPINQCTVNNPFALVLGSEAKGVDAKILAIADRVVHIPMQPEVHSLNVSHAAAIAMYSLCNDLG